MVIDVSQDKHVYQDTHIDVTSWMAAFIQEYEWMLDTVLVGEVDTCCGL